jgi:hypothetical protein
MENIENSQPIGFFGIREISNAPTNAQTASATTIRISGNVGGAWL